MAKNRYLEEFEKYKNGNLPLIGEIFNHPTQKRGPFSTQPIQYKVVEWTWECYPTGDCIVGGIVETVHSTRRNPRTVHWIRKTYNQSK